MNSIKEVLNTQFRDDFCFTDKETCENFGRDWTKVYEPNPCAVVFPKNTDEVSKLLKWASENNVAVVPSGGRTGLAGGAVAAKNEIVLSFDKMRKISEVNLLERSLHVEAGAITEAVHEHCKPYGLTWPVDFASKGSSTVGGNISTNAGGVRVIRYGLTREWVLGLTVVLMNGEILRLNGSLEKNNTGIDLRQVFIGSEGILGVITEAVLKLEKLPRESDVLFFGLSSLNEVFKLFERVRAVDFTVNAFECLSHGCLQAVLDARGFVSPLTSVHEQYVLLEMERPDSEAKNAELESWLEETLEKGFVQDAVLAQSPKEVSQIWTLREGIAESLSLKGMMHKHDIALPIGKLQEFLNAWGSDLKKSYAGFEPFIFGHIGDGNLHINIIKPASMSKDDFKKVYEKIDEQMFHWLEKFEGSVSAEHGIGLLKKNMLKFSRSPSEIQIMKDMKKIFDPKSLLNPGKIFD